MASLNASLAQLRRFAPYDSFDVAVQQCYEHWLKRSSWSARAEALPLLIGVDPTRWPEFLAEHQLFEAENVVWLVFAERCGTACDTAPVELGAVVRCASEIGIDLPASFARLYEFVRQTTLSITRPEDDTDKLATPHNDDKETVLGAALSIVATMPDKCRDQYGFIDPEKIVTLILRSAVRWFPTRAPSMTSEEMVAVIEHYLK